MLLMQIEVVLVDVALVKRKALVVLYGDLLNDYR